MKSVIRILLLISLSINLYCLFQLIENRQFKNQYKSLLSVKNVSINEGSNYLLKRIEKDTTLSKKNFFLINIWNIACGPCIKEIPILDSLAGNIKKKDIGYIFLTENSDRLINDFLKRKKIGIKNFTFMNDADDYISSIFKHKGLKNKGYPIQLIIDKTGEIKFFSGEVIRSASDTSLNNALNRLTY